MERAPVPHPVCNLCVGGLRCGEPRRRAFRRWTAWKALNAFGARRHVVYAQRLVALDEISGWLIFDFLRAWDESWAVKAHSLWNLLIQRKFDDVMKNVSNSATLSWKRAKPLNAPTPHWHRVCHVKCTKSCFITHKHRRNVQHHQPQQMMRQNKHHIHACGEGNGRHRFDRTRNIRHHPSARETLNAAATPHPRQITPSPLWQ